jgi:hypothetical protein
MGGRIYLIEQGQRKGKMKYLKMLGLAALAAVILMTFAGAGTSSATALCSTIVDPCPAGQKWGLLSIFTFSLKSGTSAKLVGTEGETLDTCTGSNVEAELTNAGSSTTTVTGKVKSLTWIGCTVTTDTTQLSNLEGHYTSAGNGTLTADGEFKVTINTVLFGSCVYGVTAGTLLGNVTGGGEKVATFVANAVAKRLSGSGFACPETSKWTAEYVYTKQTLLYFSTG